MFIFIIACLLPARSITGGILAHYVNFSRLAKNKRIKTRIRPQLTHSAKCNVHKMGKKYLKICTTEKGAALQEVASDAN